MLHYITWTYTTRIQYLIDVADTASTKCTSICRCLAPKETTFAVFGKQYYTPFLPITLRYPSPHWHHVFEVVSRMLKKAGVQPGELDVAEVHDCFASCLNRACENCFCQLVALHITHNHCWWRCRERETDMTIHDPLLTMTGSPGNCGDLNVRGDRFGWAG